MTGEAISPSSPDGGPRLFCLPLLVCLAAVFHPVPAVDKSWRTLDELSRADREMIDLRIDGPRSVEIPYLPAEPYPFESPYTAEEVGYRLMNFTHMSRWSHVFASVFGVITKSGYITQGITVGMINNVAGERGIVDHLNAKPGDAHSLQYYYYTYPPKDDGLQLMWAIRRTGPGQATKLDNFIYSPSLRRVRRQPAPRRDAPYPDNVPSFDDIIGREAWEYSWRFIGTDVLHATVRFPRTRPQIILAHGDGSFYEKPTAEFKMMGDSYPHYRPDGGIDCYVVAAEPKRNWLPGYSTAKLIYWVDKVYFYPLRIEQYDAEGELKTIQVRTADLENPNLPDGTGYGNNLTVYYDAKLDLISYSLHDAHMLHDWSEEEQKFFTPDFMRRRWLTYPQKSQALVESPEEFYLRPRLLIGRFPAERSIQLSPEIAERIQAQETTGHLVFGATLNP